MGRRKILYIHHGWGVGGAPLSLFYLVKNLNKTEYYPLVLFTHTKGNDEIIELFKKENIEVQFENRHNKHFGHHVKGHLKYYQLIKVFKIIIDWLCIAYKIAPDNYKSIKPDLIHLNSDVLTSWAYAGRKLGIPVICHNRDPIFKGALGVRWMILRKLLSMSVNNIISISKDNKNRIGLSAITEVIYNPVPELFFQNYESSFNKSKRILFLGGFHKSKGLYLLLQTIEYLERDLEIILAGYYPTRNKVNMLTKIKHKNVFDLLEKHHSQIIIVGVLNNYQVIKEMQKADLVLFPAKDSHFARPIIESYATKTPVVATNIKGMEEIVINGVTGFLVNPNPKSLAEAINKAIKDKEGLLKMGEAGYNFSLENFHEKIHTNKVEKIYAKFE